jgi:hypothetical protein
MNLTIITSVINISTSPLDHSHSRSVYSNNERYVQTLTTLQSLSAIPNNFIVFSEGSEINTEQENEIKKHCNLFVSLSKNHIAQNAINGIYKGVGESTQILETLKHVNINDFENIFKISGRYYLNNNFNYSQYDNKFSIFLEGPIESSHKTALATVMYKIGKKDYDLYNKCLLFCQKNITMLETNFMSCFNNNYNATNTLGVSGNVSIDGNLINW